MSNEFILMLHPTFGVLAMIASVWVFAETLNLSQANYLRVQRASQVAAGLMWLTFIVGGYWYVNYYAPEKAIIKAGPWPFAHSFIMETKEHVFLSLLLLATWLPIAASGDIVDNPGLRKVVLWIAALLVLMTLGMEGAGAIISMGVKVGLLAK
jgi:hypothetical protein